MEEDVVSFLKNFMVRNQSVVWAIGEEGGGLFSFFFAVGLQSSCKTPILLSAFYGNRLLSAFGFGPVRGSGCSQAEFVFGLLRI